MTTWIKMKRGSMGLWSAEVDSEDIGVRKLDQMTVLLEALVKHTNVRVEYEISNGLEMYRETIEDRMAKEARARLNKGD